MEQFSNHLRSFGRRRGAGFNNKKEEALAHLLPYYRIAPSFLNNFSGDWRVYFPNINARYCFFEIGFGSGEHLLSLARAFPDVAIIGCEPFLNGVFSLVSSLSSESLKNVRIYDGDARDILNILPHACLNRIYILFPDPWPKSRHHRRRFINSEILDTFARLCQPGGIIRFASDHEGYTIWALRYFLSHSAFRWKVKHAADWECPPPDHFCQTRYESKALSQGAHCAYLDFYRV